MKRSFLTGLGLEKECIDQIMREQGATLEALKQRFGEKEALLLADLKKAREALELKDSEDWKKRFEEEAAAREAEREALSLWQQRYEQEASAHAATRESYEEKRRAEELDSRLSRLLKNAKLHESVIPKALKLYDPALVAWGEDGSITNEEEVLESFRREWGEFFGEVTREGAAVGNPPVTEAAGRDAFMAGFGG